MFDHLKKHRTIWVVGPQRSGTRVAARMISQDTGFKYIDEREIYIDSLSHLEVMKRKNPMRKVVQAPGLTRWAHHLPGPLDLVVFMMRDIDDILASQARINWRYDHTEAMKYGGSEGSALLKQRFWTEYQCKNIPHALTLHYLTLRHHPGWIEKPARAAFKWDQTTVN